MILSLIRLNMKLSHFLKIVRLNAGLSQRDLAKKTGIAATLLSRYETGKLNPRPDTLKKIAQETGEPLANFLHIQDRTNDSALAEKRLSIINNAENTSNRLLPILEDEHQLLIQDEKCVINKIGMKKIRFPFDSFIKGLNKKSLVGYFVDDLSMEKHFKRGSLILIDLADQKVVNGRFLCILLNSVLAIKYVASHNPRTTIFVSSDTDCLIPPLSISNNDFVVVGTVIWKSELII